MSPAAAPARQRAELLRRSRGLGRAPDVDAVARELGDRGDPVLERFGDRRAGLAEGLHEREVVAALGVDEPRAQVQVVLQARERVLDEALDELRLRAPLVFSEPKSASRRR